MSNYACGYKVEFFFIFFIKRNGYILLSFLINKTEFIHIKKSNIKSTRYSKISKLIPRTQYNSCHYKAWSNRNTPKTKQIIKKTINILKVASSKWKS